ncbi:MAG: flavin reductase family protein [Thermodesulfobacteriota bacterium]
MSIKPEISKAERRITHGVYVISSKLGERVNAMTAAWVSRASFDPPLVTVAVGKTRFTHDMIVKSGVFAVNVLGPDNMDTGKHFGMKTGWKTDKFAGLEYDTKATGAPILKDCIAWMDCRVVSYNYAGDHTLFIGEVIDGGVLRDTAPLVYDKDSFFR